MKGTQYKSPSRYLAQAFLKTMGLTNTMRLLLIALMTLSASTLKSTEASSIQSQTDRHAQAKRVIKAFDYQGVRLLPGRHREQFLQVRDFYMRLRPNDVLRGFRLKQRDWAPGKDLGGAYTERPLCFGQWLGGFARTYRATGDVAVRERALYLMEEWGKTISQDGSYGYEHGKGGHYDYEKMVGGLVDVYEFIGSENALVYLDRITTWAENNLDRANSYALPTEWYTLSENLYRAYKLTGDQRYYEFAKVWNYDVFWNALANKKDVFQTLHQAKRHRSYHAYSHVNSLSSAAMAYSVTGDEKYLDTIVNAYDFLKETQLFATGGYGPEESLIVPNGMPEALIGIRRGEANVDVRFHFETSCGSWAGFKLGRYLLEFTGDAKYGDWIERLVYNGVGAMVPMNDYGMIMYGSRYNTYGAQKSHSTVWFCCQGSLLQTVNDYHNLIYFRDDESLYVNLYLPSEVKWDGPGGIVRVTQRTRFPEDSVVNLRIGLEEPSHFALKFRVPLWARNGISVQVNGDKSTVKTVPGTWAVIDREWSPDDSVKLTFDLEPRLEPAPGCISPVAVLCGPVVMVKATTRTPESQLPAMGRLRFPADYLEIGAQARINPARNLHTNQEFRPFYEMKTGEFYRMYFEREGKTRIPLDQVTFEGNWKSHVNGRYSAESGSRFSAEFTGTAIEWLGQRHEHAGIAEVKIDGEVLEQVDQYSYGDVHVGRMDQREVPFRWATFQLSPGKHTIEVEVTEKQNPLSNGNSINVTGLSVYR